MDQKIRMRRQDFWAALMLIAGSLFFLYKTSEIPFFRANAAGVESGQWYNSAAIVPYGIFIALLCLSVSLLVISIRQGGLPQQGTIHAAVSWCLGGPGARMIAAAIIMLAYIFALVPRVDFIISSALVLLALVYGFHETRARATWIASFAVIIPSAYALIVHLPQAEWTAPHDDDWVSLAFFFLLAFAMFAEIRISGNRPDRFLKAAPVVAVLVPFLLVIAMAFGFRQNIPNRTGLIFKQIEYRYYVTVKPWLFGGER